MVESCVKNLLPKKFQQCYLEVRTFELFACKKEAGERTRSKI